MAATVPALDTERIRDANIRYHDAAAHGYDSKWAIDFGEIGAGQVLGKLSKALGRQPGHYARALEIGAGTGYFSLNLARQGVIGHAVATDISPGMLERLAQTAKELGVDVDTRQADAESLPFPDESFDLVLGHAVLHHLPGLDRALAEFHRVLAPGGTLAFMGEPSAHGDRLAAMPKRLGALLEPAWRRAMRATPTAKAGSAPPAEETYGALEGLVDVHTFTPGALQELAHERRLHRRAGVGGGAARERLRLVPAPARGRRRRNHRPARLAPLRIQQLPGTPVGGRQAARATAPGGALLQPADLRPPPRLSGLPADP